MVWNCHMQSGCNFKVIWWSSRWLPQWRWYYCYYWKFMEQDWWRLLTSGSDTNVATLPGYTANKTRIKHDSVTNKPLWRSPWANHSLMKKKRWSPFQVAHDEQCYPAKTVVKILWWTQGPLSQTETRGTSTVTRTQRPTNASQVVCYCLDQAPQPSFFYHKRFSLYVPRPFLCIKTLTVSEKKIKNC